MSIPATVRTHGAAGTTTTPPVAGDSSNGFTQAEVDAILAAMPNDDDTVVIAGVNNGNPMTKTQVRALLTTNPEQAAAPAPAPNPDADLADIPLTHPSGYWLVEARGGFRAGLGDYGHSGAFMQALFGRSIRIGDSDFFWVPRAGFEYTGGSQNYETPGGEAANSTYHLMGAMTDLGFRWAPTQILDGRLNIDIGLQLAAYGLLTPGNTYEDLPRITGDCPDGIGRAQCEAGANPGRANAGSTGLRTANGGSRDAEGGSAFRAGIMVGPSYQIPIGDMALRLGAGFEAGVITINPNVGSGGTNPYVGVSGMAELQF